MREPVVPQLNAEEYLQWEARQIERYELHHGFVVSFAGGTFDHDTIAFNVRNALQRAFPRPCRTFGSDIKVKVSESTFFYADAAVVCEGVSGSSTSTSAPKVVCEVLSKSTRAYDLVEKRAAYRSLSTLVAYIVVHTQARRMEIDLRAGDDWQTIVIDEGAIALGSGDIALDDVYDGTGIE